MTLADVFERNICALWNRFSIRFVRCRIVRRNVNCVWFLFMLSPSNIRYTKYKVFSLLFYFDLLFFFSLHLSLSFACERSLSYDSNANVCVFFIASKCHFITVLFRLSLMFVCVSTTSPNTMEWTKYLSLQIVIFLINFIRIK